jgi:hypothetical protein
VHSLQPVHSTHQEKNFEWPLSFSLSEAYIFIYIYIAPIEKYMLIVSASAPGKENTPEGGVDFVL